MVIFTVVLIKTLFIISIAFLAPVLLQAQQFSIYQGITTSNGLPSNYVFTVGEDENGFLWAGTDKGLCRFNGFSWQVWDKDNGLPGNYINSLYSDKRGGLYITISGKGAFYFDIASGKTKSISGEAYRIDRYGNLYFHKPSNHRGFINLLVTPAGKNTSTYKVAEFENNGNFAITADEHAKVITCLVYPGSTIDRSKISCTPGWRLAVRFLPKSASSTVYTYNDSVVITNCYYYKYAQSGLLSQTQPLFIPGNTYAHNCITKDGVFITDVKTGYYYISNNGNKTFFNSLNGLGSDYVNYVYELKDGTIAFATLGAGIQLIKNDNKKSFTTGNRTTRSIVKSNNNWYILSGNKVFIIDQVQSFIKELGTVESSALNLIQQGGSLIVGSLKGIHFYSLGPKLTPGHFIPLHAGVSSIIPHKNSFIASTYGNGLIQFESNSNKTTTVSKTMAIIEKTLPIRNGYAMLSYEDGVMITDTINKTTIHLTQKTGLLSNSIQSLFQQNDTTWICTKGGINIYTNNEVVKTIKLPAGETENKAILCFYDSRSQFWVIGDKNLYLYSDYKLKAITSIPLLYDKEDIINTATYDSKTETLALGTLKSISLISLAKIKLSMEIMLPALLNVSLDGKEVKQGKNEVPYEFGNITFNVAPFATAPFMKCAFFYNLKGRDTTWKKVNDSLAISFSALRPGKYTLMARLTNADGFESGEVALSTFVVKNPYWLQWPFIALCIILLVGLTILMVRSFEKQKRKKKEEKLLLQQSLQIERERISKDLHDHLGSNLVTMVAQVDSIESKLYKNLIKEAAITVNKLSLQAREVMYVLRETVWAVQENEHSLESFTLRIRTFLQRLFENTTLVWQLKITGEKNIRLTSKETLHLFRVIQEASQNVLKHSMATEVAVLFEGESDKLKLTIKDNGVGFNSAVGYETANGLHNMKQRIIELNGNIKFETTSGVSIQIEIPLGL